MSLYQPAFDFMMSNEDPTRSGEVTPDPTESDPHAIARFGINSFWHPEAETEGFYQMPVDKALEWVASFYKYRYFAAIWGYQIACQDIANKYFDLAVNTGPEEATKIVQRACNSVLAPIALGYKPLGIDGLCGERTYQAINACAPEQLLPEIKSYAVQFYKDVAFREHWSPRKTAALLTRANK